jgi:ABC-type multidrug transport system ATPase subunit
MSTVLQIKNLTKKYGKFIAVNDLSLTIKSGQIFGVLGPNGSGKTTTLGMILGVINQSSGSYAWFGEADFKNCRKDVGSILEHPIFYPDLSAYRNLEISARIKGCNLTRIELVLNRVGLLDRKDSKYKTYSLGMKQRLALASALLADPDVLVLDEPTNGLDPQGINQMRELILSIAKEGKTIIISSHLLDEIQKMCSHVAILKKGKLIRTGSIDEILSGKKQFEIDANVDAEVLLKAIDSIPFIFSYKKENNLYLISCKAGITAQDINKSFFEKEVILSHLILHKVTLEQEFLNIIK